MYRYFFQVPSIHSRIDRIIISAYRKHTNEYIILFVHDSYNIRFAYCFQRFQLYRTIYSHHHAAAWKYYSRCARYFVPRTRTHVKDRTREKAAVNLHDIGIGDCVLRSAASVCGFIRRISRRCLIAPSRYITV